MNDAIIHTCTDCQFVAIDGDHIACIAGPRQGCRRIHPVASDIDLRTEVDFDVKTDDHADQEVRHA